VSRAGAPLRDVNAGKPGQILLYLWLCGVLFFGIRFGRQIHCARRLVRRATRVDHPRLAGLLADAKSSLRMRPEVAVLQSSQIDIPLATGILHPVILLPASACEWTEDELRIVLLHELAHVRRADISARALAMIACAIHWFNPLVWMLGRLSTRDAELAADDLVLYAGVRPSTYADALLNLAGSVFHVPAAQPAMPLARRGGLADRVHAILRESHRRTDIGRFTRIAVIAGSCAIGMLAACVRLAPATAANLKSVPDASVARIALPVSTNDSSWIDSATDGLIRALADVSPQVRGGAAHSLGRLHAERARSALLALANDPDKYARYEADQALAALDRTN
jgi:beta-lactamase regulating signal transducer with metallopeptidase domain